MSEKNGRDSVSIIYHQKSDSPKYFEIKKSKIFLILIGLPTITLISLVLGAVGLVHTSPFHLMQNYKDNNQARIVIQKQNAILEENEELRREVEQLKEKPATPGPQTNETSENGAVGNCPAPVICSPGTVSATVSSIGLSTLSFFRPIQGQKDRTRPAQIKLSGFKTAIDRDNVNLQFNIIPAIEDESKISGHIIVLMKNESGIQVYPIAALAGLDHQINFSSGEPFATQRFRPVDASFPKPRRGGNTIFTVFIFSRTGDLIHYQNATLAIKI